MEDLVISLVEDAQERGEKLYLVRLRLKGDGLYPRQMALATLNGIEERHNVILHKPKVEDVKPDSKCIMALISSKLDEEGLKASFNKGQAIFLESDPRFGQGAAIDPASFIKAIDAGLKLESLCEGIEPREDSNIGALRSLYMAYRTIQCQIIQTSAASKAKDADSLLKRIADLGDKFGALIADEKLIFFSYGGKEFAIPLCVVEWIGELSEYKDTDKGDQRLLSPLGEAIGLESAGAKGVSGVVRVAGLPPIAIGLYRGAQETSPRAMRLTRWVGTYLYEAKTDSREFFLIFPEVLG